SVLPPPSRFAWASASALTGRDALLEFASTTSRCGADLAGLICGGAKVMNSRTACRTMETASVTGRMSLVAGGGVADRVAAGPLRESSALIGMSGKSEVLESGQANSNQARLKLAARARRGKRKH